MSIIFSDLYDEIVEAGVADSPAAKLYIEQAIEPYIGCRLDVPAIIDDLRDHFTPSALDCLRDYPRATLCRMLRVLGPPLPASASKNMVLRNIRRH